MVPATRNHMSPGTVQAPVGTLLTSIEGGDDLLESSSNLTSDTEDHRATFLTYHSIGFLIARRRRLPGWQDWEGQIRYRACRIRQCPDTNTGDSASSELALSLRRLNKLGFIWLPPQQSGCRLPGAREHHRGIKLLSSFCSDSLVVAHGLAVTRRGPCFVLIMSFTSCTL